MSDQIKHELELSEKLIEALEENGRLLEENGRVKAENEAAGFWSNWVYPEGAKPKQIQNELIDYRELMQRVALVYEHVTHGRISKLNTMAESVIAVADDCAASDTRDAIAEETEELRAGLARQKELYASALEIGEQRRVEIERLRAQLAKAEAKIAELEGVLSGDPNLTADKEQRERWRLSAVRYSDKVAAQLAKAEAVLKELDSATRQYAEYMGPLHSDDCPEDDTCNGKSPQCAITMQAAKAFEAVCAYFATKEQPK
jgi:hypothetical protein